MAHANTVMQSVNDAGGQRCVDIFRRPDGSFGFEEYRRDAENPRGWFPIGHHAGRRFETERATLKAATAAVSWFDGACA